MGKWRHTRIGIIDLGTNSVRFDVHDVRPKGQPQLLHREKLMVRLGENVFLTGKLERSAIRRTVQAFSSFKRTADDLHVDKIVAFGTSALREAADSDKLLATIRRQMGIELRVISGKEEAKLIAAGVLSHQRAMKGLFGLIDIGGGSTEISLCRDGKILFSESFPLGVARLQQLFLKTSPPEGGTVSIRALRRHVRDVLKGTIRSEKWPNVDQMIGSSGTVRALARLSKKTTGSRFVTRASLKKAVKMMTPLTVEDLGFLPGMEPKRVDLILAGTLLLEETMQVLDVKRVSSTDYSLRDGILDQELRWFEPHQPQSNPDISGLFEKALSFAGDPARLKRVVHLTESLFQRLRNLHNLDSHWGIYLTIAALFRKSGRAISPVRHESHSYYIVKHADLPLAESWETEFIALLCLHHEDSKFDLDDLPFDDEQKSAFVKLLSILRVVDALDSVFPSRALPEYVRLRPDGVHLTLSRSDGTELSLLRLQQRKDLFEQVFDRPLLAKSR